MRSRSYIATPPGATIREQLKDRKMSQKEFALRMDMSEKHISRLINGEVALTPETAMRLEMVLGVPAHFWNSLEAVYREKLVMVKAENETDAEMEIAGKFPYREMQKNGWVPEASKPSDRVIELRKFFEVVSLTMLKTPLIPNIACRRQTSTEKADYALLAWAQKAKLEARKTATKEIDLKKLEEALPAIREMTSLDFSVFSTEICSLLSGCGVALVFLPHITGSFLNGAAFRDGNRIVVGLTARGKDVDKFWFSFFHETAHILYGHIESTGGTTEEEENTADSFARDLLIPPADFSAFVSSNRYDRSSILSFAEKEGIDPSIVVGRLQKEKLIGYSQFNDLKRKYTIA